MDSKYLRGKFDLLLGEMGFVHLTEKRTSPRLAFYVLARGEGKSKGEREGEKGKNRVVDGQQEKRDDAADDGVGEGRGSDAIAVSSSSSGGRKRKMHSGLERSEEEEKEKEEGRPSSAPVTMHKTDSDTLFRKQRKEKGKLEKEAIEEGGGNEGRKGEGTRGGIEGESGDWMAVVRASIAASSKNRGVLNYFRGDFSHVPTTFFSLSMSTVLESVSVNKGANVNKSENISGDGEGGRSGVAQGGRRKKVKIVKGDQ